MSKDNSTSGSNTGGGSNATLEFIGIAVFVGIALFFFIRYAHAAISNWRERGAGAGGGGNAGGASPPRLGLAPADIAALPTFVFPAVTSNGGAAKGKGNGAACPVCLADVEEGEVVRMLPSCRHFFHDQCIDVWLCSHTSCPVCRAATEPERIALGGVTVLASPPLPQLRRRSSPRSFELSIEERISDEGSAPSPPLPESHREGASETSAAVTGTVGPGKVELRGPAVFPPLLQLGRCSTTGSSTVLNVVAGPKEEQVKLSQASALAALPLPELRWCSTTGPSAAVGTVGSLETESSRTLKSENGDKPEV